MATYQYTKLDRTTQEIRLVTILPGSFDGPIRLTINHTSLNIPDDHHSSRKLSMNEIQNSLPDGWEASETVDGRFLFTSPDDIPDFTSWTHPDLKIERGSYDPPQDDQLDVFQPKYEALSYTWGSSDNPQTVHVDDSLSHQPTTLLIGQNLACAIRHLRYSDRPRTLWVDAICINQDDIQERGNQVACMGHIYSLASRVIAWLGPQTSNSGLALSTLEFLGRQIEYTRDRRFQPSPGCDQPT